jgi:hypothetical protein
MPPLGAGVLRVTGTMVATLIGAVTEAGRLTNPIVPTTTAAVVVGMVDTFVLAVMVELPAARLTTWNDATVCPLEIVTEVGTVATAGLLETRFTTSPSGGADDDSVTEAFWTLVGNIPIALGLMVSVPPTPTVPVAVGNCPPVVAVIVTEPKSRPLSLGADVGVCDPAGMMKLAVATGPDDEKDTFEGSLIVSVRKTADPGAWARLIP